MSVLLYAPGGTAVDSRDLKDYLGALAGLDECGPVHPLEVLQLIHGT